MEQWENHWELASTLLDKLERELNDRISYWELASTLLDKLESPQPTI